MLKKIIHLIGLGSLVCTGIPVAQPEDITTTINGKKFFMILVFRKVVLKNEKKREQSYKIIHAFKN